MSAAAWVWRECGCSGLKEAAWMLLILKATAWMRKLQSRERGWVNAARLCWRAIVLARMCLRKCSLQMSRLFALLLKIHRTATWILLFHHFPKFRFTSFICTPMQRHPSEPKNRYPEKIRSVNFSRSSGDFVQIRLLIRWCLALGFLWRIIVARFSNRLRDSPDRSVWANLRIDSAIRQRLRIDSAILSNSLIRSYARAADSKASKSGP